MFNFNIGVLGHVDSGKTTLSRCISTTASTAAFDKNPQSQERGITLDLGFSCFDLPAPQSVASVTSNIQITLVDCPGHASLIRTIIAGAQIIDAMILVVDVTKGIQTQTAECLVIGEILCSHLLVVLNKVDLLPLDKRSAMTEKMTKRIRMALQSTKFSDVKIVPVAAKPGGGVENNSLDTEPVGIQDLLVAIQEMIYVPTRSNAGPFVFAVDHCFGIRGQGTIMTGTVLQGAVAINDSIEIPSLAISKKVKSMQMFRKPVEKAIQGDRVGICVTQFDPKLLERGFACTPGFIKSAYALLVRVVKIPYYKLAIETKAKFHISVGNETVMSKIVLFGSEVECPDDSFDYNREYKHQEELMDVKAIEASENCKLRAQYAVLHLERRVPVLPNSFIIGSKLDMDAHTNMCRLAFKGTVLEIFSVKEYAETQLPNIKVFKNKTKEGIVERLNNDSEVIVRNLFNKDTNLQPFIGLKVRLSTGEEGVIDGHFGTSGKIKVFIAKGLLPDTKNTLQAQSSGKKKGKNAGEAMQSLTLEDRQNLVIRVKLDFKRYLFSVGKKMIQ
ncbi:selenocysteine-specific elongation factor-like [Hyalella azteca]|nr:selenocysteine-specific elongation factor-like [Hyalella azteca]